MDSLVSCVPPGFRFHPTDEELVGYYLKKKVAAQKIDLDVIRDVDLYRIEPWDLQECCRIGCEEQTEWYFFSHKDKKYPTGTRTNRATMAGFWKATGRDKAVHDEKKRLIGMRKTLVFYKGRAPNGHKSDWIIHEYRLQTQQDQIASPQQEEGWVVCRAFKKRTSNIQITRSYMQEDHNNNYHPFINNISPAYQLESTSLSSQLHLLLHQQLNSSFQLLPQLEAPQNNFLPLSNSSFQRSSLSMIPHNPLLDKNKEEEAEEEQRVCSAVATDWRELDKFVASQLSHEEDDGSDMAALLLLESNEGEEEQVEEEEEEETEQEGEEERRRFGFCS